MIIFMFYAFTLNYLCNLVIVKGSLISFRDYEDMKNYLVKTSTQLINTESFSVMKLYDSFMFQTWTFLVMTFHIITCNYMIMNHFFLSIAWQQNTSI